jgi:alanyl-tRNA synthetase
MTERVYYTDAYCTSFTARVVEQLTWDDQPAVVLDRTAFYPTSGGQPADRGTLDGVAVTDVVVREKDAAIVHVLERAVLATKAVRGELDWHRRFDHMQQHTGQHILSAAFGQLLDADTVGFHLGTEMSTLDLDKARLDPAAISPIEELANRVIWDDRVVSTRFISRDELAALPLRRPPAVTGRVRIVEIIGSSRDAGAATSFDVNPCGGTHVARTGEIGLVKIVRLDYRGDETRVEFLCGERALRDYDAKNRMSYRLASMLTVGYWELDQAVERLQVEAKRVRQDLRRVRKRLLEAEASELAASAVPTKGVGYRVVWRVWGGADDFPGELPKDLRALSLELAQQPDMVVLLVGIGERTHLCFARGEVVDLDMAGLLRDACERLGGRGGGQPGMAQGSAPATDVGRVKAVLSEELFSAGLDLVEV